MYEQSVTELGIFKVSGISVKLLHSSNMPEQSVTEFPIVNVSGIVVKLEQYWNMPEQLVIEFEIWMISIIFPAALKCEWLPIIWTV